MDISVSLSLKRLLFLMYVFLLPIDATTFFKFHVGFLYITILDLIIVIIFFLILAESAISDLIISHFELKIYILFLMAFMFSLVSLSYIHSEYVSYDIKISLSMLEFTVLIFITVQIINDMNFLEKVMKTLCLSVFIISFLAFIKSLGFDVPGYVRTASMKMGPFSLGVLGGMNGMMHFAVLILATLPFVLKGVMFKSQTVRLIFSAFYLLASILSLSRSLWISLTVQIILFIWFLSIFTKKPHMKLMVLIVLLSTVLTLTIYMKDIFESLINIRQATYTSRLEYVYLGIKMITSNPLYFLFGAGKGSFYNIAGGAIAHNLFLDLLISKGFVTTLIITLFLYEIVVQLFKIIKKTKIEVSPKIKIYSSLFLIALAGMLTEGQSAPITNLIMFWTVVAIICSFISIVNKNESIILEQ